VILGEVQTVLKSCWDALESTVGTVLIVRISSDVCKDPLLGEVLIVVQLVDLFLE
jgi:hypothetical protein